jgi:hypothetical protein
LTEPGAMNSSIRVRSCRLKTSSQNASARAANVEGTWNEHMRDLRELEWASPGEGRVARLEL